MNVEPIINKIEGIEDSISTFKAAAEKEIREVSERQREISDRLLSLEQAPGYGAAAIPAGDIGNSLARDMTNSKEVTNFLERKSKSVGMTIKAKSLLPNVQNNITISTPATNPSEQIPGVVGGPEKKLFLRQFLMSVPAAGDSFTYTRELAFTNNAAPQNGEGTLKAESDITFEEVVEKIPTFAHWLKVSRQVMKDNPNLVDFNVQRLRYGLEVKIEDAIINGDGLNGTMNGLLKTGNYTVFTPTAGDTQVDSVRKGILALESTDYQPGLVIMNHSDITDMELLKDTNGDYIVGQPVNGGLRTIWGVPLYGTNALTAGTFVALDTSQAVSVHMREDALVEFSNDDSDNFTKNLVTILAETRIGLAVQLPGGVISGALTA